MVTKRICIEIVTSIHDYIISLLLYCLNSYLHFTLVSMWVFKFYISLLFMFLCFCVLIWIEITSIKVYFYIVVFCIFQKTLCVSFWLMIFLSKYKQWMLCVYSAKQTKKIIKQIVINRHPLLVVIQFIDVYMLKITFIFCKCQHINANNCCHLQMCC